MIVSLFIAALTLGQADMQAAQGAPPPDLVIRRLGIKTSDLAKVDNTQAAMARDIGRELTCLCGTCPKEPITDCRCGWAGQNKDALKHMVARGMSREEILGAYRKEYGDAVLAMLPNEGFARAAWLVPYAFGAVALVGFFVVARMQMKKKSATQAKDDLPPEAPASNDVKKELARELDELD